MDDVDIATELIERNLALALRVVRASPMLEARGVCLYCEATLDDLTARWCDAGCRDDWQRAAEAARRNVPITD